ncbi:hypothetical protein DID88_003786 [Monilinia fructigena]|uniref:Uncharacterized protein n=1 Tax=Monilinia fructigena TaxID=38457 RepID=A0A395IVC8_9HELO|nr:hypothetical protein DID88_003786 [Monilinia fructigena]
MENMERDSRSGMSTGTMMGSWTGKFDLISKTIHYFDNKEAESRKQSIATTMTLNDGDMTRSSTRKHSHTVQLGANASNYSGCDSRNTTICSSSVHKPSIVTASTDENDISSSSSAPTDNDLDGILPLPRTLPPKNIYLHTPETKTKEPDFHGLPLPPPTSRGMWTLFRTHMNPLPLSSFFASNSKYSSSSSDNQHSYSRSQSEGRNRVFSEGGVSNTLFCNAENTLTTQVWSVDNGHRSLGTGALAPGVGDEEDGLYDQDDVLGPLKPGTRAYRERERREMVGEREERKRKASGGLSVEKTFEVVKESGGIVHAGSS